MIIQPHSNGYMIKQASALEASMTFNRFLKSFNKAYPNHALLYRPALGITRQPGKIIPQDITLLTENDGLFVLIEHFKAIDGIEPKSDPLESMIGRSYTSGNPEEPDYNIHLLNKSAEQTFFKRRDYITAVLRGKEAEYFSSKQKK